MPEKNVFSRLTPDPARLASALLMIVAIFLCVPLAYLMAFGLRARFLASGSDPSRCDTCEYSTAGLGATSLCPECGNPPQAVSSGRTYVSPLLYLLFAATCLLAPGLVFLRSGGDAIPYALVTWTITSLMLAGCVRVIDGAIPRRVASVLLLFVATGAIGASMVVIVAALLIRSGVMPAGEYGPEFDIAIGTVLGGPVLALNAGGWLFFLAGGIVLCRPKSGSHDPSK